MGILLDDEIIVAKDIDDMEYVNRKLIQEFVQYGVDYCRTATGLNARQGKIFLNIAIHTYGTKNARTF